MLARLLDLNAKRTGGRNPNGFAGVEPTWYVSATEASMWDPIIREQVRGETEEISGFLNRPFTDAELALGLHSFLLWVLQGKAMKAQGLQEAFNAHTGDTTGSARATATDYARCVLGASSYSPGVRNTFPAFDRDKEQAMARQAIGFGHPDKAAWDGCPTRVCILATRCLAKRLTEDRSGVGDYFVMHTEEAHGVVHRWLAEHVGEATAQAMDIALLRMLDPLLSSPGAGIQVVPLNREVPRLHDAPSTPPGSDIPALNQGCGCLMLFAVGTAAVYVTRALLA